LIEVVAVDEIAEIPEVTFSPTVELSVLLFIAAVIVVTEPAIEIAESMTADEVSISLKTGTEVEPAGASINAVVRVIESPFAPKNDIDTVAEEAV
jgi:dihydroxyacetone kinase DhaKLM complex PTS-EIIA-like component DhaM